MSARKLQIQFLLFVIAILAKTSFSQTIPCDLNVKIFDTNNNISNENISIKFYAFDSKKNFKFNKSLDGLSFMGLNSGIYQIELSKKEYKKKVKKFWVDCDLVDSSNIVFENIQLWRGNNKEVIKLDTTNIDKNVFVIGADTSSAGDKTGVAIEKNNQVTSVEGKIVNGKAINLVRPPYPAAARAVKAAGSVNVQITIDEDGNVIRANVLDGHELLRSSAIKAVRQSKFSPTLLEEYPVRVTGVIVYNFSAQ